MSAPWTEGACYLIAEAGVNHDGQLDRALRLIDVAVEAGADAVKFQSFRADELASAHAPKAGYQRQRTAPTQSQQEMLRALELSPRDHEVLRDHCRAQAIEFLSTPFDIESARLLIELGVPALKVPSGELTHLPFLRQLAQLGRPLIVSTGMATLAEVEQARKALEPATELVLLHCVSQYPAPVEQTNLRAMQTLATHFDLPAGLSDHTLGIEVSLAAAALGAQIVEKHFTLDPDSPGPDHAASLAPDQLAALVEGIRKIERCLGDGRKVPAPCELETRSVARRSLVAARHLSAGTVLEAGMVAMRRPGTGLSPAELDTVLGLTLQRDLPAGALLQRDALQ